MATLQTFVRLLLLMYPKMLLQRGEVRHDHGADVTAQAGHPRLGHLRRVTDDVHLGNGTQDMKLVKLKNVEDAKRVVRRDTL